MRIERFMLSLARGGCLANDLWQLVAASFRFDQFCVTVLCSFGISMADSCQQQFVNLCFACFWSGICILKCEL